MAVCGIPNLLLKRLLHLVAVGWRINRKSGLCTQQSTFYNFCSSILPENHTCHSHIGGWKAVSTLSNDKFELENITILSLDHKTTIKQTHNNVNVTSNTCLFEWEVCVREAIFGIVSLGRMQPKGPMVMFDSSILWGAFNPYAPWNTLYFTRTVKLDSGKDNADLKYDWLVVRFMASR